MIYPYRSMVAPHQDFLRTGIRCVTGSIAICLAIFAIIFYSGKAHAQFLEQELLKIDSKELGELAQRDGDAARGAVVFFQQSMACARCHSVNGSIASNLGPSLVDNKEALANSEIVDAVLQPSKTIRKGFDTASVITTEGETITGLLVEKTDSQIVLRDANNLLVAIPISEVDQYANRSQSMMPAGQLNQLTSRQQFLDLVKYLIEIRDGGSQRAKELQPSDAMLAMKLPEYEERIDHAGFVREWGLESLARGEAIYRRVCGNCHGTKEELGSLPTALRFAEGKFKNGSDPLSMYRTLTRGFGFMPAQSWMVPSQKYDVIHYIRETFLRPFNSAQLVPIDPSYLAGLPPGA